MRDRKRTEELNFMIPDAIVDFMGVISLYRIDLHHLWATGYSTRDTLGHSHRRDTLNHVTTLFDTN